MELRWVDEKTQGRMALRPISWGKGGVNYQHPAYDLPMSKTSPVDIYWSSEMSSEIELF